MMVILVVFLFATTIFFLMNKSNRNRSINNHERFKEKQAELLSLLQENKTPASRVEEEDAEEKSHFDN